MAATNTPQPVKCPSTLYIPEPRVCDLDWDVLVCVATRSRQPSLFYVNTTALAASTDNVDTIRSFFETCLARPLNPPVCLRLLHGLLHVSDSDIPHGIKEGYCLRLLQECHDGSSLAAYTRALHTCFMLVSSPKQLQQYYKDVVARLTKRFWREFCDRYHRLHDYDQNLAMVLVDVREIRIYPTTGNIYKHVWNVEWIERNDFQTHEIGVQVLLPLDTDAVMLLDTWCYT